MYSRDSRPHRCLFDLSEKLNSTPSQLLDKRPAFPEHYPRFPTPTSYRISGASCNLNFFDINDSRTIFKLITSMTEKTKEGILHYNKKQTMHTLSHRHLRPSILPEINAEITCRCLVKLPAATKLFMFKDKPTDKS